MFGFSKKKKEEQPCCCNNECSASKMIQAEEAKKQGASVKILGSGCAKCNELEKNTKTALDELGMDNKIDHVTDFVEIAAYGVMTTPALVIDGRVVAYGKVLKTPEIKELLQKERK